METIISQIETVLANFQIKVLNEETKLECLNAVNAVLYPLKENKTIDDFYFSASIQDTDLICSVFIKEVPEATPECWEFVIKKG